MGGCDNRLGSQSGQLAALTLPGMRDKGIGDANVANRADDTSIGEKLGDPAARATCNGVLLEGDQQLVLLNQRQDHRLIQRLDPTHVHHCRAQRLGGCECLIKQHAKIQNGDSCSLLDQVGLAYLDS